MKYYEWIQDLEIAQGSNEKIEILKNAVRDTEFLHYVIGIYDPMRQYWVKDIGKILPGVGKIPAGQAFKKLLPLMNSITSRTNDSVKAVRAVVEDAHPEEQEYLLRFIKRDMRCGINAATINKACPGAIPKFEVSLASPWDAKKVKFPCIVDQKLDGIRCVVYVNPNMKSVHAYSRNGKTLNIDAAIELELLHLCHEPVVIDAELIGTDFEHVMSQAHRIYNREKATLKLAIFDVIKMGCWIERNTSSQFVRKVYLRELFKHTDFEHIYEVDFKICENMDELQSVYQEYVKFGHEGVVVKDMDAPYAFKRSKAWIKLKPSDTWDGPIVGWHPGKEGTDLEGTLGAFIVKIKGNEVRVGSGFSREYRDELWEKRDSLMGKMVEVKGDCLTNDGSIRFPSFVKFRPDKD